MFSLKLSSNFGLSTNLESSLGGLTNPDFPYPKYQSGKPYSSSNSIVPYGTSLNPVLSNPRPTDQQFHNHDITNLGSLKESLQKNLKILGATNLLNSETPNNNHLDEQSSFNYNRNQLEDVNNMLNEASDFNCHQIQAANFDSQLSTPAPGGEFTGVENRLEESSLIYGANHYASKA